MFETSAKWHGDPEREEHPLNREELESLFEENCSPDDNVMEIFCPEHENSPVAPVYVKGEGVLVLLCAKCGGIAMAVRVSSDSEPPEGEGGGETEDGAKGEQWRVN